VNDLLHGLEALSARELTLRLRLFLAGGDRPVTPNELALVQELQRRARRAAKAELLLAQQADDPGPVRA
jgi:hypothetical protein